IRAELLAHPARHKNTNAATGILTGALPVAASEFRLLTAVSLLLRSSRRRRLLEAVRPAELLAEALDAAGGVDELLLPGEERMAVATDIDVDLGQRAAGLEGVAAGTVNGAGLVFGMGFGFHGRRSNQMRATQASPLHKSYVPLREEFATPPMPIV